MWRRQAKPIRLRAPDYRLPSPDEAGEPVTAFGQKRTFAHARKSPHWAGFLLARGQDQLRRGNITRLPELARERGGEVRRACCLFRGFQADVDRCR